MYLRNLLFLCTATSPCISKHNLSLPAVLATPFQPVFISHKGHIGVLQALHQQKCLAHNSKFLQWPFRGQSCHHIGTWGDIKLFRLSVSPLSSMTLSSELVGILVPSFPRLNSQLLEQADNQHWSRWFLTCENVLAKSQMFCVVWVSEGKGRKLINFLFWM